MINLLFGTFPRLFSNKRLTVNNKEEFYNYISKGNGIITCNTSLYSCTNKRATDAIIDKIYLDLDTIKTCLDKTIQYHEFLMNEIKNAPIEHRIIFSGHGFNIYTSTNIINLNNRKATVANTQRWLAEQSGLTIGEVREADIEKQIIGDIAKMVRIPGTQNVKTPKKDRKKRGVPFKEIDKEDWRYCIPINEKTLYSSYDDIRELAKIQPNKIEDIVFGKNKLDISQFDFINTINVPLEFIDINIENIDPIMKSFPPLLQYMITTKMCGWRDRYLTILGMRECGISMKNSIQIVKKYWTKEKVHHSLYDEGQFEYIYSREDLFFPNWDTLRQEGYPVTDKDREFRFYK